MLAIKERILFQAGFIGFRKWLRRMIFAPVPSQSKRTASRHGESPKRRRDQPAPRIAA
jgi:hypothetical protein